MIEIVADTNQHFNTRAKNSGIHEIAPSKSTFFMKSLSDIAVMLKEIKEGQPVTPITLKQQANNSQQKPIKYCGICSCNSHHTDECLQIQEDNTIAAAQNFVDFAIIPPNNKQYHVQGPNAQPVRWNPTPQQLAQSRQPYMSTIPQHTQNVRYQSPYLCQQSPPTNDPPNKYGEIERIRQKENQEMMEMQNQIPIRLNQIAEMLQKSTSQQIQPQPQAPVPDPLPPQPLQTTKGFLNAIHDEVRSEDESENTDNEEAEQHFDYEDDEIDQERETEDEWKKETQSDEEKFCINTISDMRKDKEELPAKCEDPGACLVTCKIRGVDIHECLCDPGASGITDNVLVTIGKLTIPVDFHILKPTPKEKKGKPQVLLGIPFLKTRGFEQEYHDDTFKFSAGKTTERFQIVKKRKDHGLQKDDGRMRGKESAQRKMIEALAKGWVKMLKEELEGSSCAEQKNQKNGSDKTHEKLLAEYPSITRTLNKTEKVLCHNKGADAHLMAPRKHKTPQMPTRFSRRLAALKARQTRDEAGPSNAAPRDDEIINISSNSEQEQENVQEEGGEIEEEEVSGDGALIEVLQPLAQEEPEDIPYDGLEDGEMEEEEEDPEEDLEEDPEEDPEEEPKEEQEEGQDWVEEDEIEEEEENEEEEDEPDLHPGISDYDEYFHDYFKLGPPPSPASDKESDDE
ncbi:hypothetical protein PIB30_060855 [Stylosanthes scabra]|uniref:Uncharacterized protein n=1 Tax=Stylosanthes scabra TaxID=79078 RepID=A0ABU6WJ00_9FABA|nr:hypothetical protein [Stylosanthes scabra]